MQRLVGEFGYSRYSDEVQFRRGEYYFTRRRFREAESAYEHDRCGRAALGLLRARALQARLDALQAGLLRGSAAPLHGASRLQALGRLRLRSAARGRGRAPRRGHVPRDQLELLESRRSRGARRSTTRPTATAATRTASIKNLASSTSTSCATTTRRPSTTRSSSAIRTTACRPSSACASIGIYEGGDFPKLVVESKKSFATKYGLQGEYWQHFDSAERPEVLGYLKTNLQDLANHYHALYQEPASRKRNRPTTPRRSSGTARSWRRSRRTSSRRASTTSSRTCCSRTATSARPRASTSARLTSTRRTSARRRRATPRSSRIASS